MSNVKEKALKLPQKPGVYLMLNQSREVIYVGKAKKLLNRVSSYFRENANHNSKTRAMVRQVHDFDYIVTDTEFEALVLENSLIKRHMPKYNILLKDDKGYPFIRVSVNEDYPRFSIVSKPSDDGARYFGPYSGRYESHQAIDSIRAALKLPVCNRNFPRDIGKARPCLNHHLGKCCAVCSGKVTKSEYREMISCAVMLLEGKIDTILEEMTSKMLEHSEKLEFESAGKLRDEIHAMQALGVRQKVLSGMMSDTDIIALHAGESKTAFSVLHYINGALLESETKLVETPVHADRAELLGSFLKQYYMARNILPREIYLSDDIEDRELLSLWLSERSPVKVRIIVPQRGEKLSLVRMAEENARQKAAAAAGKEERISRALIDLQKLLSLNNFPDRIESFDISNTAGSETVASMIVFEGGIPAKKEYRKYKIETMIGQDDCAAMREAVSRRLARYINGDAKFSRLPDLLLLDGGKAQTHTIFKLLSELNLSIPVFGMVKDERHRTRAIIAQDGSEIGISSNPSVFKLVGSIQEEVHRFAITYHKQLRSAVGIRSSLRDIPGVGDKRAFELLRHFKSIARLRESELDELLTVVPKNVAHAVYQHFHKGEVE